MTHELGVMYIKNILNGNPPCIDGPNQYFTYLIPPHIKIPYRFYSLMICEELKSVSNWKLENWVQLAYFCMPLYPLKKHLGFLDSPSTHLSQVLYIYFNSFYYVPHHHLLIRLYHYERKL